MKIPLRLLVCAAVAATVAPLGHAQNTLSADAQNALAAQVQHFAAVAKRGRQVYYTPHFDLSGMPHYHPQRIVEGWIRIAGNNYLADGQLGEYWARGFAKFQPGVHLSYYLPSDATSFGALEYQAADIVMDHEPGFYDLLGYERIFMTEPLTLTIVTGSYDVSGWDNSVAILVNDANPLTRITVDQLDGIFGAMRDGGWSGTNWRPDWARGPEKNIRTWGQMGLGGDWADKPIDLYGFTLRYNTATSFSDKVLRGSDKWNENIHTYANYLKPDGTRAIEADQIMTAMQHDPYGIAYVLFRGDKPGVKRLAVAPRGTTNYVEHTLDNVQNRTYPLYNEMFLYLNLQPGNKLDPKLKEFCRYVLSQEGQEQVERDGKYLPLTAEVVREQLAKLN